VRKRAKPSREADAPFEIAPEDRAALLQLARATIAYYLQHHRTARAEDLGVPITDGMRRLAGGFVTLHKHGQLRGCIGEIAPERELYRVVHDQALNAAFRDPRFPPLQADELDEVDIEISVLTPPQPVASWQEIEVGRHGVILQKSGRSAVFLPQVAPEQGWDRETMLTHLSMKAGLPPDAWREGARFEVFEAIVFGER